MQTAIDVQLHYVVDQVKAGEFSSRLLDMNSPWEPKASAIAVL